VSISQGDQAFTRLSLTRTAPGRTMSLLFFVDEWRPEGRGCGEGCGEADLQAEVHDFGEDLGAALF